MRTPSCTELSPILLLLVVLVCSSLSYGAAAAKLEEERVPLEMGESMLLEDVRTASPLYLSLSLSRSLSST
jgi:hypothetical protein